MGIRWAFHPSRCLALLIPVCVYSQFNYAIPRSIRIIVVDCSFPIPIPLQFHSVPFRLFRVVRLIHCFGAWSTLLLWYGGGALCDIQFISLLIVGNCYCFVWWRENSMVFCILNCFPIIQLFRYYLIVYLIVPPVVGKLFVDFVGGGGGVVYCDPFGGGDVRLLCFGYWHLVVLFDSLISDWWRRLIVPLFVPDLMVVVVVIVGDVVVVVDSPSIFVLNLDGTDIPFPPYLDGEGR